MHINKYNIIHAYHVYIMYKNVYYIYYREVLGAGSRVFFKSFVAAGTSILKNVIFDLILDLTFKNNEKVCN